MHPNWHIRIETLWSSNGGNAVAPRAMLTWSLDSEDAKANERVDEED